MNKSKFTEMRETLGCSPLDGSAFVFRSRRANRIRCCGCPGCVAGDADEPFAAVMAIMGSGSGSACRPPVPG